MPTIDELQAFLDGLNNQREALRLQAVEVANTLRQARAQQEADARAAAEEASRVVTERPVDVSPEIEAAMAGGK